jgi:Histidine kinase-, DNA gyrase B-, and HSP90-like ATPase
MDSILQYSHCAKQSAAPNPAALFQTFRAMGYGLETALADILDNAISADAKNIYVHFLWEGIHSKITIQDDGKGMSNPEIIEAMRPATKNATERRLKTDLGRFGMGLKTASFSQCRRLTLISKQNKGAIQYWSWDLDYMQTAQAWDLLQIEPPKRCLQQLDLQDSGTIVLWENMDNFIGNAHTHPVEGQKRFLEAGDKVKKHLAMIFHRYIEQEKVHLYFNQRKMEAWDPFFKGFEGCQPMPEEALNAGQVQLKGYILPHRSKLTERQYKSGEGMKGWNRHQGFYVYRNERMLIAGDWLGLFKQEEHYKLTRIIVDISNVLDAEWQIDIKKSTAILPYYLKAALSNYALKVRSQAVAAYRQKGKTVSIKYENEPLQQIWQEQARVGKRFYEINRAHPIVKNVLDKPDVSKKEIQSLLKFIEESLPISTIAFHETASSDPYMQPIEPFEATDSLPILTAMKTVFHNYLSEGRTVEYAKGRILRIEPFNHYPQYIEQL